MTGELRVLPELERRGGWPGPVEHRDRVTSTNTELRQAGRDGAPAWSVLTAAVQTGGRGRHGRAWHSPQGNLYLSVLLPPPVRTDRVGLLPLLAGLAVVEALSEAGVEARLKWPNDVLTPDGRKLAGILAEASSGEAGLESIVIGIGINLVSDPAAPADVAAAIGLARDRAGRAPDPSALAAGVLVSLRGLVGTLDAGGDEELRRRWRSHAVSWWGQPVEVTSGDERLSGIARDLDPGGGLVLEMPDGTRRLVTSGDARRLRPAPR